MTPSIHPEVPDTQFVSPGRGLGIMQSTGWREVSGTAVSGVWVLEDDSRPDNLDHLRVRWRPQGTYDTPRARLSVFI